LTHDLVLPIWKSNVSVALMIDKKAKSALSLRLFGEDITTVGREFADQKTTKEKLETETGVVESPPDPDEGSE
jgi:multisite-specific tRNA:(cytosine-C5)-methyltransferase